MEFLIILSTSLVAASISALVRTKQCLIEATTIVAVIIQAICMALLAETVARTGAVSYLPYLALDSLGAIFGLVVALVGCMAALYSTGYVREEIKHGIVGLGRVRQFYALFHLFLFSMFAGIFTTNPVLVWIAIEATTLSTVFLISFYGKPATVEAAWKFFIINSVALLLGFLGTLLFMATPAHFAEQWFFENGVVISTELLKVAFLLVMIGYGTKTGFVPLHTWLPDAHSMAPSPISSLLSGALLNVSLYALLRFKLLVDSAIGPAFSGQLFLIFGLASVLIASLFIFTQQNYKRLLAYSSIEHMGIIALGFGAGGAGIFAALLHIIYHAITKSLLFLSSGNIILRYGAAKITEIRGIKNALPITSIVFFIGILSITGVPPFGMFITEFSILTSLVQTHPILAAIVLCALALVFIGFLKHFSSMVGGEAPQSNTQGEKIGWTTIPLILLVVILVGLSFTVPSTLHTLLTNASKSF